MSQLTYSSSSTTTVCKPFAEATLTASTKENMVDFAFSSSFLFLEILNLNLNGTPWIPFFHNSTFNLGSNLTSSVPMCNLANFLISLTAFGALFLKVTPWSLLCKLMVYSLVTASFNSLAIVCQASYVYTKSQRGFKLYQTFQFTPYIIHTFFFCFLHHSHLLQLQLSTTVVRRDYPIGKVHGGGREREQREQSVCAQSVCASGGSGGGTTCPWEEGENFSLHLRFFLAFFFFFAYVLFLLLDVCVSPLGKEDGKHP